jgi:hypothetical protein
MNRYTLGVVALLLLIVGGFIAVRHPEGGAAFSGACVRIGMVLGAAWLAWPQIAGLWNKTPRWLLIATGIGILICVVQPLWALAAIPVLAGLWFLAPKITALWKTKSDLQSPGASRPAGDGQPVAPAPQPRRPRRRPNAR